MKAEFTTDLRGDTQSLPHFWEHTVGSDHAPMALRADYQAQLRRAHQDLGFKHVRFHGVLSDDMGTLTRQEDQLVESFFNADQIWDFLLSIGMKPFVELSFMPNALSSGDKRVFKYQGNVTPPKDFEEWGLFIKAYLQHLVRRYGEDEIATWSFEVWNEPNLPDFWTGTKEQYFELYRQTVTAAKSVSTKIRVGGPATAKNEWIADFLAFTKREHLPVDFITTHQYPTDAFGQPGDDTQQQLAESHRGVLREQAEKAHRQAEGRELYYTEWGTSSNPFDDLHDQPYAAAFVAKTVLEMRGLLNGYSYWTFSDLFEENYFSSKPFHGGFGLMTIHGIPKPSYRAFELLHALGDRLLHIKGKHPTVDAYATVSTSGAQILFVNSQLPKHPIKTEHVKFTAHNAGGPMKAFVQRIDSTHANPRAEWLRMEKPDYLSRAQVESLDEVSRLQKEHLQLQYTGAKVGDLHYEFELDLEPQSVALVTLEL